MYGLGYLEILVLLLLATALGAVILVLRSRSHAPGRGVPGGAPQDLSSLSVKDARRGDVISIPGAGAGYEDLAFTVEKIHRYEWGSSRWYELVGASPAGMVSLEWEEENGLAAALTLPGSELELRDLAITEQDLLRMDEEQSSRNEITHDGTTYRYQSSHETGYFEDGRGEGEGFYLWELESEDGREYLSIEKWEGEAFTAFCSRSVDPAEIRVYRRG